MAEFIIIFVLFYIAIIILMIAAVWTIFLKAGKPGWAAIVPFYNVIVLLQIVGKPWWWFLLLCIPIVNIVLLIIVIHRLSLSFGHEVGFTLGLIFLGFIFYPILGFGSSKYIGPGGAPVIPQQPPTTI
jgi:hypothetical protein